MSKVRVFLFMIMLAVSTQVYAQFSDGKPVNYYSTLSHKELYVLYRPTFATANKGFWDSDWSSLVAHGVGLGYEYSTYVSRANGLSLSLGLNGCFSMSKSHQFYYNTDDTYKWYYESAEASILILNFRAPLSLVYDIPLHTRNFSISPFVGINGTVNAFGKGKITTTNNYGSTFQYVELLPMSNRHNDVCNFFNIGWHLGTTFLYNRFSFRLLYSMDILPLYKSKNETDNFTVRTQNLELNVGFRL